VPMARLGPFAGGADAEPGAEATGLVQVAVEITERSGARLRAVTDWTVPQREEDEDR
jgi:hypothetical protein